MAAYARPHGKTAWWNPEQQRYITSEFVEMPEDSWLKEQVLAGYVLKRETEKVAEKPVEKPVRKATAKAEA